MFCSSRHFNLFIIFSSQFHFIFSVRIEESEMVYILYKLFYLNCDFFFRYDMYRIFFIFRLITWLKRLFYNFCFLLIFPCAEWIQVFMDYFSFNCSELCIRKTTEKKELEEASRKRMQTHGQYLIECDSFRSWPIFPYFLEFIF